MKRTISLYSRDGHLIGGGGDGRLLHARGLLEAGGLLLDRRTLLDVGAGAHLLGALRGF